MSMVHCPICHGLSLFETTDGGDTACTACGYVMEESAIVAQVEFVETAGGTSAVLGQYVSSTSTKPYGGGSFGMSRESREAAMENARRRLQQIAGQLNIPAHFVDAAHRLYILALDNNFTHGRRVQHVLAACLYIVCRRERSSHLLIDFAEKLRENVFLLGATYLKFLKLLSLQLPVIDPSLYIHRFAANMDLGDDAQQVANTALRIVGRMKRDWIQTGRRPAGICGACLLIAARVHGYRRTRAEVQQVVRVTDATIRNRLAEFQNTPSSLLTPDEFDTLELQNECDPPSYVRGLLEEELAKEQAMLEDALAGDSAPLLLTDGTVAGTDAVTSPAALRPSLPPATSGVQSKYRSEALVTEEVVDRLLANPRLRAVIDNNLLVSEQDLGPRLSKLAAPEVLAEQHRLGRSSDHPSDPSADPIPKHLALSEDAPAGAPDDEEDAPTDIILAAGAKAGLTQISKNDVRLWKVRALLHKDWGRGRETFMKVRGQRELLMSKLAEWYRSATGNIVNVSEEGDAAQISGNLHLLSEMVAGHAEELDNLLPKELDTLDSLVPNAEQGAASKQVAGHKRKRQIRNDVDGQSAQKDNETVAEEETTKLAFPTLKPPRRKVRPSRLDQVYVSLATEYSQAVSTVNGDTQEAAPTVNKILYDRKRNPTAHSSVKISQHQSVPSDVIGLANKDYEEAESEILDAHVDGDVDETLSDLDDADASQYLVSAEEADKRHGMWTKLHGKYLDEQKRKREIAAGLLQGASADGSSKTKKARLSRSVASAGEAAQALLGARKLSKKINYEALNHADAEDLFDLNHTVSEPNISATEVRAAEPKGVLQRAGTGDGVTKIQRPGGVGAISAEVQYEPDEDDDFIADAGYGGASGGAGVDDYTYYGEED